MDITISDVALYMLIMGLGLVVLFHLYWAAGGRLGADIVIPRKTQAQGGAPLFHPSPVGTMIVAVFLAGVIFLAVVVHRGIGIAVPWNGVRILLGLCGVVFVLRAIGEFRYVGFFKKVRGSAFAYWDTRVFSPFILIIGLACLTIALLSSPLR